MGFTLRPSRTVVTSFKPRQTAAFQTGIAASECYEHGDWVFCLATSPSTVSCALSNGEIQVYDQQRLHLLSSFSSEQHGQPLVKDLQYGPNGNTLISAGQDGTLVVVDLRQNQPVLKTKSPTCSSFESVSLGYQGNVAAAGTDKGKIHFFDFRNGGGLLGAYGDSHADALSQVVFASMSSCVLLSGGADGLACCFDTRQPTEELALKSVLNVGTPLRRVGFCGDNMGEDALKTVFCLTGSETASLWDWETASCLQNFGDFQLRHNLSQSLAASQPQLKPHSVDYLIDAHWDASSRELILATGSASGEGALFRAFRLSGEVPDQWQPYHYLKGGHRGIIRAWCPLSPSTSLSAGEDARLVEWNRTQESFGSGNVVNGDSMGQFTKSVCATPAASGIRPGGPLRRHAKRHKVSTSPY